MPLTTLAAGPALRSEVNANFALCVLTDTSKTITVTHSWTASQTFTGGFTAAAACDVQVSGMTSAVRVGQFASSTTYGLISFNAAYAATTMLGLVGKSGDDVLQLRAPTGGGVDVVINNATAFSFKASGLVTPGATPASAAATGTAGQVVWDASFIYVCTATNTWKRVAIATW